ncbi:MAG: T9SS type A sorting domain-containing protein, partial [Psychroserpens sp.]|nr:T9SS type A sorting domain-containing protein [Psychroserpens sp.]
QTITVEDNQDPAWDNLPADMTVGCSATIQDDYETWLNSISGTDNCGTPIVTHNAPVSVSCPDTIEVTFVLTDACGNSISATATFIVETTLHILEDSDSDILIFPNPTKNHIYIKGLKNESQMEVFNIAGQKVLSRQIRNEKRIEFDLNSGLYIIKLISGDRTTIKKLIIK